MDYPERVAVSSLPQPQLVFTTRCYEALFPWCWNPGLHSLGLGLGWLAPQVFLLVFTCHTWMWDHPFCQPPPPPLPCCCCHIESCLPQLIFSTAPTSLDEYFFFKSLVVRLPYSLILWLFWLYLVWGLAVNHFMVVLGGEVCLPVPPSWLEVWALPYSYSPPSS